MIFSEIFVRNCRNITLRKQIVNNFDEHISDRYNIYEHLYKIHLQSSWYNLHIMHYNKKKLAIFHTSMYLFLAQHQLQQKVLIFTMYNCVDLYNVLYYNLYTLESTVQLI